MDGGQLDMNRASKAAKDGLRKDFGGEILLAGDAGYDERGRCWTRDVRADLRPWASGAVCLNLIGDEGRERIMAGFGVANYARLARVKAPYGPDSVLHLNHNIRPA